MSMNRFIVTLSIVACCAVLAMACDESPAAQRPESAKSALQRLNELIGGWRGIGQVRRGSADGAWQEKGEFVWDFQENSPAIRYVVADGKLMSEARITWDPEANDYRMTLTTPKNSSRTYHGHWDEKRLVFVSSSEDGERHRLTITPLNEKRTLVLHERSRGSSTVFTRVAEIGYTREGTHLASSGSGQPECIVTGGLGTMRVSYQGKTYYVCCSGCKQAFEDDPEAILAEAAERLKKERERDRNDQ